MNAYDVCMEKIAINLEPLLEGLGPVLKDFAKVKPKAVPGMKGTGGAINTAITLGVPVLSGVQAVKDVNRPASSLGRASAMPQITRSIAD